MSSLTQNRYASKFEKCSDTLKWYKEFLEKYPDPDPEKARDEMKEFNSLALKHCKSTISFEKSMNAIKSYSVSVPENGPERDYSVAKARMEQTLAEAEAEAEKENPKNHRIWRELFSKSDDSIKEVPHRSQKDEAVYEQLDESIMCSTSFTAPIDPISKTVIKKPVRNKNCQHVYDKDSIYDYIRQSKKKAMCPYMACKNNRLVPGDLVEDNELEERISQYLSTQQEESTSDDEDSD